MWELLGNMKNRVNTKIAILKLATKITYIRGEGVNYEISLLFYGFLAFLSKLRSNLFPLIQRNFLTFDTLPTLYIAHSSPYVYFLKEPKL